MKLEQAPESLRTEYYILLGVLAEMEEEQINQLPISEEQKDISNIDWLSLPYASNESVDEGYVVMYKNTVLSGLASLYAAKERGDTEITLYHMDGALSEDDFSATNITLKENMDKVRGKSIAFYDMENYSIRGNRLYNKDKQAVGNLVIKDMDKVPNSVSLEQIQIDTKHQRKGVGTEVMREIMSTAQKEKLLLGLTTESMLGKEHQSRLRKWYSSLGFSKPVKGSKVRSELVVLPKHPEITRSYVR